MPTYSEIVSLFSGGGGFDSGFRRAGFKTRLANEKLEAPAQTLANNLKMTLQCSPMKPEINGTAQVIQGQIEQIDFGNVNGYSPDVLIGGPPCQDFSMAQGQHRAGLGGERGKLYTHFIRTVAVFQPKVFVFENVEGLVSADKGVAYKTILDDFKHLGDKRREIFNGCPLPKKNISGYEILFNGVIDAAKFGVAQTRKRLIIIGLRLDLFTRLDTIRAWRLKNWLASQLNREQTLTAKFPLTIMEVFEGLPLSELGDKYREVMKAYDGIWNEKHLPQAVRWRNKVWNNLTFDIKQDYLASNEINPNTLEIGEWEQAMVKHKLILKRLGWLNQPVYNKIQLADGTHIIPRQSSAVLERLHKIPPGENHEFVMNTPWHVEGKRISFIYKRAWPLKPSPTVMAYGGGGTYGYHYERNRGQLTLREKARIQTFSDEYLFSGDGTEIRAQIGEAVPPLMGEEIAYSVRKILSEVSRCPL